MKIVSTCATIHSKCLQFGNEVRHGYGKRSNVLAGGHVCARSLFKEFVQLYSDKTATMLEARTLIAYHVHAVLLNSSLRYHSWLKNSKHTVVRFLPLCNVESWDCFIGDEITPIHRFTSGSTV